MITIQGRWNSAICYCNELDEKARQQIQDLCDQQVFADAKIRIMPDVHAGAGCTIGTTMTIADKVAPSLVGVDIGCGMETIRLAEQEIDFDALDKVIRTGVPSGRNVRETAHPMASRIDLTQLRCASAVDLDRAERSLGTLGGGNHFIEVDRDEEGCLYLVIHTGSRHLGSETANHYRRLGWRAMHTLSDSARRELIDRYQAEGRTREIQQGLEELTRQFTGPGEVPEQFAYVEGDHLEHYLHDMALVQTFAALNRQTIARTILEGMGLTETERFTTIHNYIDTERRILRKGAVSAQAGERLLIPINMRDGALICEGRGNPDWNCSAPHGAGRILSRSAAQSTLTMEAFRREMAGIYTTCVAESTLDESPMAYKSMDAILSQISPTAKVLRQIKPVYNYKAGT